MKYILSFETSCDDTSVAVLNTDYEVLSNVVSTQKEHLEFGGVLPELASRMHMQNFMRITQVALDKAGLEMSQIDALAVSVNPGLKVTIVGLALQRAWLGLLRFH